MIVTKLIINMNQADKESIRSGTSPMKEPGVKTSSIPPVLKAIKASTAEIAEIRIAETAATIGFIFGGRKMMAKQPDNNVRIWRRKRAVDGVNTFMD